jgi:hypothetical protein
VITAIDFQSLCTLLCAQHSIHLAKVPLGKLTAFPTRSASVLIANMLSWYVAIGSAFEHATCGRSALATAFAAFVADTRCCLSADVALCFLLHWPLDDDNAIKARAMQRGNKLLCACVAAAAMHLALRQPTLH